MVKLLKLIALVVFVGFGITLQSEFASAENFRGVKEVLDDYRRSYPQELLKFELPNRSTIITVWSNAKAAADFYHSKYHEELKESFGLDPNAAHKSPEDIAKLRELLNSPQRVKVINSLNPMALEVFALEDSDEI